MNRKLRSQEVKIYGNHAGYQFPARNTYGRRTVKTTVTLCDDCINHGTVSWKGRTLIVVRVFPHCDDTPCLYGIWETIKKSYIPYKIAKTQKFDNTDMC